MLRGPVWPAGLVSAVLPAALAVQDGFLAAALAEAPERRSRIDVYDTSALGAGPAYQKALAAGAQAVAGPLIKEELASLVASQPLPLPAGRMSPSRQHKPAVALASAPPAFATVTRFCPRTPRP